MTEPATAVDPPLPEALLSLFANRAAERERALMKDAAVMGYVQGTYHRRDVDVFPKDSWIIATVIEACLGCPDLYRTISGYVEETDDDDTE